MSELGWKYLTGEDKAQIVRGIRDGVAYGGPYHVEIHPADRCNIECFFCSTAALRGTDELPVTRLEELIGELKALGTRAIRLSGGGEPLFHRRSKEVLRAIAASGIPIENLTTNAVLLSEEHASILVECCDQVTVSLNTADQETYASMMQTPARNFERVVQNVRGLIAERRRRGSATPRVNLQFLVWRENYRSIPRMYELARELDVDTILFNGLSFLKAEQKMTEAETAEMMVLYESVIRIDEFRRIASIESYEQDIQPMLGEISARLEGERRKRGAVRRLVHLATRRDLTLRQKLAHRRRLAALRRQEAATSGMDDSCVIGWHSMLIRTSGVVAPCCILQGAPLGNVFEQSVSEVWFGERYARFRSELSRILQAPAEWEYDAVTDQTVVAMCGRKGSAGCPIKSFYYRPDVDFMRQLS
ncbi:MAG: radical SAM/SPASM domain-containing protein, partial [Thermoanaerobaculia bacterium]